MPKVNLNTLTSGYQSNAMLNDNFDIIEQAFDNTLSLDGSTPNAMQADLDMNSQKIINLADPVNGQDAIPKSYADANYGAAAALAAASSAADAATSASNASTSASSAATSASNASTSASAAAASATLAQDVVNSLEGTSTTSLTIGTGTKVFTTQSGKAFEAGVFLMITSDVDVANYMHGQVTSYVGTTLTMNITTIGGSGTLADWTIRVSGPTGATGATGAPGVGLSDGDKGDITISGTGTVLTIDNDAVTYAKMQNVSDTSRILGRRSAGAGDVEENTLSQVLDMVGSAADGDLLIRSGGSWTRLGIGSSGQGLVVSSGLPAWGTTGGLVWLGEQNITTTTANVDLFTQFDNTLYGAYIITGTGIVLGTSGATLNTQFSRDKSTIVTTDYFAANGIKDTNGTIGADTDYGTAGGAQGAGGVPLIHCALDDSHQAASTFEMRIFNEVARNTGLTYRHDFPQVDMTAATPNMTGASIVRYRTIKGMFKGTQVGGQQVNGVRFKASSGNITQGKFTIYGLRKA